MDVLYCTVLVIFSIFFLKKIYFQKRLPPSPWLGLPILGHLHFLKRPWHRTLQNLSAKYGPIFYLRLGNRPVIFVSSPSLAEECFTKNDIIFANRPPMIVSDHSNYNNTGVASSPYGEKWRSVRRIMSTTIFSSAALNDYSAIRTEEVRFVVRSLISNFSHQSNLKVNLRSLFSDLVINLTMKPAIGRPWSDSEPTTKSVFGADIPLHLCDFIPFLRWIGYGRYEKMVKYFCGESNKYMQYLVDDGRKNKATSKTVIQSLLSLQEADSDSYTYTDDLIKGILSNLLAAGTETTALTMQWVMSLLLNHPHVLEKVRDEIDVHCTSEQRLIEDSDLSKLPYLRCVINETLRLFPAGPLLLPHLSSEECTVGGFNIPRGTILVVNAWAIHRDPNVWEEPNKFKPERFDHEEETMKEEGSRGFKFLPFGMGRRACPGMGLAMRVVGLTIGTLIQCFEWERDGTELVDLEEGSGVVVLPKMKPLEALYKPRPNMHHLFSQL